MYLQQLFSTLADALDNFSPDLVIWISGADNHRNDRFGQMHLSLKEIQRRDEVLLRAMIKNQHPCRHSLWWWLQSPARVYRKAPSQHHCHRQAIRRRVSRAMKRTEGWGE